MNINTQRESYEPSHILDHHEAVATIRECTILHVMQMEMCAQMPFINIYWPHYMQALKKILTDIYASSSGLGKNKVDADTCNYHEANNFGCKNNIDKLK